MKTTETTSVHFSEASRRPPVWPALIACGLVTCAALGTSCSSEEDPSESDECRASCPNSSVDLTAPTLSFAADVFPILAASCNEQLCHGSPTGPRADLYLGPAAAASNEQISAVHADLQRPSTTAPALMVVAPGNPQQSFMMLKVDGCQNSLGLDCDAEPNLCRADCGDPMPPLPRDEYPALSNEQKNTIRRWIAQGAMP